jgi:hypothetical protein
VRAPNCKHRHQTISRRPEPSSFPQPQQPRAKSCSTAFRWIAFLLASDETGTRFAPSLSLLPGLRTHNDLKSQTMNRSQSRRLSHARPISFSFSIAHAARLLKNFLPADRQSAQRRPNQFHPSGRLHLAQLVSRWSLQIPAAPRESRVTSR